MTKLIKTPKPVDNSTEKTPFTSVNGENTLHAVQPFNPATKPLTRKQKAFVKYIVDNPTTTTTDAVLASYGSPDKPVTRGTANSHGTTLMHQPNILHELAKYSETAERTLVDIMQYSAEYGRTKNGERQQGSAYASVSARIADSLLDRLHGKATQRIESTSQSVNINVDLTA